MTAHEASGRNGAALLYDWRHARLEVVFSDGALSRQTNRRIRQSKLIGWAHQLQHFLEQVLVK